MASTPKPTTGGLRELRRLVPYLRRYRRLIIWGIVFITVSNVCSTTIPRIVGATIDALKASSVSTDDVTMKIVMILALTVGSGLFMFATRRTIIVASRHIEEDLRNDFVVALQRQAQKFYHDRSTGSILAHASNDIAAVREFIGPAIMYSANTVTTFAFAITWMVTLNGTLTALILLPVPLVAMVTYHLGKRIHERYKDVQQRYEQITTQAQESFSGVRVVRAYDREGFEADRFEELSDVYYRENMRLARTNTLMMPAMSVLFNISYVAIIAIGGWLIINHDLSVGDLTQFFIYLNQLLWPIAAIGWVTGMIQRGAASIGRLGLIMEEVPLVRDEERTDHSITSLAGSVRFRNVTLSYGERVVLDNIDLNVPAGSSVGIVGSVGSGKSSLVQLLPRLYDTTAGTVEIDGHDVRTIPLDVLRGAIAMVPQESFLFSETIRENIRFARPSATDADVVLAAERAQLAGDVAQLPAGYDTVVGERGITLSGGQKQRTALARAILAAPSILVLDDSLSAVDTDTEERILRGLAEVMRGRTTFVIAHRVSTIKHCSVIVVLQNGAIVEQGSHTELLAANGIYADMHERQLLEEAMRT